MLKRRDFLALSGAGTAALAFGARPDIGVAQELYEPQDAYGPRAALIIGNGNYAAAPQLPNPVNDARSISAVLSEIGFDVAHAEDADFSSMRRATDDVSRRFPRGGVGLIYYAGHGVQFEGVNYLLPSDIRLRTVDDLKQRAINANTLLNQAHDAGVALSILILDACRNNPFGDLAGSLGTGLAIMNQSAGDTFIAFAAAAGKLAFDGKGANSPFTGSLVTALDAPERELFDVFRIVRRGVNQATGGRQLPWVSSSVERRFIFRQPDPTRDTAPQALRQDATYWRTIRESQDPADFKSFLGAYPDSEFAPQAKARLERVRDQPSLPVSVPVPRIAGREVTKCEVEADDPADPQRVTDGVHPAIVNTRLAIRLCSEELAQDLDNPKLQFLLGRSLDITRRLEEAQFFFERSANAGYPAAMAALGVWYWRGRGDVVAEDLDTAASWLQRAATLDHPVAQTILGQFYERGWSVPQSDERAVFWYEKAVAAQHSAAVDRLAGMYRNGKGVPKDPLRAAELYREAAQLGNTNAINTLGRMYLAGEGVPKDVEQGLGLLEQATEFNNIFAPFHLGQMYRRGNEVEKDPSRALAYFRLSAERGFAQAMNALGEMYERGEGGPMDLEEAYFHYYVAREVAVVRGPTDTGRADAERHLAALSVSLSPARRAEVEARANSWIELNIKKLEIGRTFRTRI